MFSYTGIFVFYPFFVLYFLEGNIGEYTWFLGYPVARCFWRGSGGAFGEVLAGRLASRLAGRPAGCYFMKSVVAAISKIHKFGNFFCPESLFLLKHDKNNEKSDICRRCYFKNPKLCALFWAKNIIFNKTLYNL